MKGECEFCGYETEIEKYHHGLLCEVCASTIQYSVFDKPLSEQATAKQISYCTNMVLDAIRKLTEKREEER